LLALMKAHPLPEENAFLLDCLRAERGRLRTPCPYDAYPLPYADAQDSGLDVLREIGAGRRRSFVDRPASRRACTACLSIIRTRSSG
jgi:hypothetical protein